MQRSSDEQRPRVSGRLVGEQQWRIVGESPRERDTLLLAARELGGQEVQTLAETELLQEQASPFARGRPGDASEIAGEFDVLERIERGEEVEVLEHEPEMPRSEAGQAAFAGPW
jgi:hypothetical protein